jgi:hypothetical protein
MFIVVERYIVFKGEELAKRSSKDQKRGRLPIWKWSWSKPLPEWRKDQLFQANWSNPLRSLE